MQPLHIRAASGLVCVGSKPNAYLQSVRLRTTRRSDRPRRKPRALGWLAAGRKEGREHRFVEDGAYLIAQADKCSILRAMLFLRRLTRSARPRNHHAVRSVLKATDRTQLDVQLRDFVQRQRREVVGSSQRRTPTEHMGSRQMIARDVMTVDVVTVSPDHSVSHAAQIMLDHHISGLPVLDDQGHLVGIVTEGDFLRRSELGLPALSPDDQHLSTNGERARSYVKSHSWKVADVMTANLVQVDEGASLTQIAALMEERGIKRLPVMRGDNLVGIVSRADLLHALITATLDDTAPGDYAIRRSILTRLKENSDVTGVNLTITVTDGMVHLWGVVNSESERDLSRVVAEGVRGVNGVYDHLTLSDRG